MMGVIVHAPFAAAGAKIDDRGILRNDETIISAAPAAVPREITLTPRNLARRVHLGGDHLVFGLVAGSPIVHDRLRGRRSGNLADYRDFIRLAHHFNAIHLTGNQVTAPLELSANNLHLDSYLAKLALSHFRSTAPPSGGWRAMDGIRMMAIASGLTLEEMARDPGVIPIISVSSPPLLDDAIGDGQIAMAENGQPVTIT